MAKKDTNKAGEELVDISAVTEVAAPVEEYKYARVLEDFSFPVTVSKLRPAHMQPFKRKTIINNPMLIKQMLQCNRPIELINF